MKKKTLITVQNIPVNIETGKQGDYICLTDMAKAREGESRAADIIKNWIRTRTTLEFLGTWEEMYNPDFKVGEFDHFKMQAGLPSFALSPGQWAEKTNAIGIYVTAGRYGGTYAHKDIAFEFGSAISSAFKLYLVKEFQRLKEDESSRLSLQWNLHRTLAKVNYRIHTDSIKENIIPPSVTKAQADGIYASEADLLNVAMFGQTAAEWRQQNKGKDGNIRDDATVEQLLVLANLESLNAEFIRMKLLPADRLKKLNEIAIHQLKSLLASPRVHEISKQE